MVKHKDICEYCGSPECEGAAMKRNPTGTINHPDLDVTQVSAALADRAFGGGLSDAYYRQADDALARLAARLPQRSPEFSESVALLREWLGDDKSGFGGHEIDALDTVIDALGCDEDD